MTALSPARRRIAAAVRELRLGRPVLVADSTSRENEVDAILAAELATPEWIGWLIRHSSGYLCVPMSEDHADRLGLPLMVPGSQDRLRTAYTITADAASGVTTGISAHDRARTARVLAAADSTPADLTRPGHVLPLRAVPGGLRQRGGHTEAAVELCRLAGRAPVGVISELVHDDGSMLRYAGARGLAEESGLVLVTVEDLIEELDARDAQADRTGTAVQETRTAAEDRIARTTADPEVMHAPGPARVSRAAEARLPTRQGVFTAIAYRDEALGTEHLALVSEGPGRVGAGPVLVRVHSECVTGDVFHSLRCECGAQLERAMDLIGERGGVLIRLGGQEGRGIGLAEKIRAYALQDGGRDTVQANLDLGWPSDLREYCAAADILRDLQATRVRLLTNNPDKVRALEESGIEVVGRVPLVVGITAENLSYMRTKARVMGHRIDDALLAEGSVS